MRVFVAIELDDNTKQAISNSQQYIKKYATNYSLVNVSNLHLTLQFVGEADTNQIDKIIDCIKAVKAKVTPFAFTLFYFGTFKNNTITYLGGKESKELRNIHNLLYDELVSCGFTNIEDKFTPHITIARKTKYQNADELLQTKLHKIVLNCDNITLFHSYREGELIYKPLYKEVIE